MAVARHAELGQKWRAAREASGHSVQSAADAAEVHRNSVYKLENGDDDVTVRMMMRLAAVYGVTFGDIFSEPSAERVPNEIRPLVDLLQPLDMDARIAFVRNVVANARFMARLTAVGDAGQTVETGNSYHRPSTDKTDHARKGGVGVRTRTIGGEGHEELSDARESGEERKEKK